MKDNSCFSFGGFLSVIQLNITTTNSEEKKPQECFESRINEYYIMKNQLKNNKSRSEFLVGETFRQDSLLTITTNKDKRGGL